MKPLSPNEVQNLAQELKTFEGSRLQEVRLHGDLLCFGFYQQQSVFWLLCDLNPQSPQLFVAEDLAFLPKREDKKPIILFLRAHVVGRKWSSVEAPPHLGRVLNLKLTAKSDEDPTTETEIELRLIPRAPNVIVKCGEKSLSLHKPNELKPLAVQDEFVAADESVLKIKTEEWFAERRAGGAGRRDQSPSVNAAAPREQAEAKIKKAIASIEKDLQHKRGEKWSEVGEWLKVNQTLDVPPEYAEFIERKKNLAFNLENCFRKAKEVQKKIAGAEARLTELQEQLVAWQTGAGPAGLAKNSREKSQLLKGAQAKGRTFELSDGFALFIGKSGEDNLRVLREAKPWYLWVHLRDEPSAHAVIARNKNQNVKPAVLHEAAHHLLAKTYGERQKDHWGEKYTVLVAECRFVRPIKGDRLGRVHYSNENSFLHLFKNS